jgi:Rrf2 family cysteine metabolism transcriptional repressor
MMKLSTRGRYGVMMMFEFAANHGNGPLQLREIGKRQGISEKYLSNLIIPLKGAGLVVSFRGARGGYSLSRSPKEITLFEIIQIMEGGIVVSDESDSAENPFKEIWSGLNRAIEEYLQGISLEDLVNRNRESMYYI